MHARAFSSNVICDDGSQKGTKKFVSSKRIKLKEYSPPRRGMAMGDIAMEREVCAL